MDKKKAMMKIESFSHKDGTILLSVNDYGVRAMLKDLVELCQNKYGSYIKLELSPPYKPKTQKELGKYWSMCTEYANFLGMTKEEVSEGIKYRAMSEGLWNGVKIPFSDSEELIPESISKSNTQQLSVLIEVLYRLAAEDGFTFEQ